MAYDDKHGIKFKTIKELKMVYILFTHDSYVFIIIILGFFFFSNVSFFLTNLVKKFNFKL